MLGSRTFVSKHYPLDPKTKSRDYPNHNLLKYGVFIIAALFLLVALNLPLQKQIRDLNTEKQKLQAFLSHDFPENKSVHLPGLLALPTVIEQCRGFFQEYQNQVLSVNLERLGEESMKAFGIEQSAGASQSQSMNYALVRFKLTGTWNRIEESMQRIENLSDQAIQVQEVHLTPEGSDVEMKIYFYEPDNPSLP